MKVECCICMEDFLADADSKILTPKCGHLFHELCMDIWFSKSASCPQCRKAVTRSELHLVHLRATEATVPGASGRRSSTSSINNSAIRQDYHELSETLLTQQEKNVTEIEHLKKQLQKMVDENRGLKNELRKHVDEQMQLIDFQKLTIENLKSKILDRKS